MALARRQPDQAGQQIGAAGVDHQPPSGEGPHEAGLFVDQDEVTGQGQVGPGPHRRPVDGGDGGLVQLPELADEGLHAVAQGLAGVAGVEPGPSGAGHRRVAQIHAGAEGVADPGDQQGPDLPVGPGLTDPGHDLVAHLRGQGILGLGTVEDQAGDTVFSHVVADHRPNVAEPHPGSPRPTGPQLIGPPARPRPPPAARGRACPAASTPRTGPGSRHRTGPRPPAACPPARW